MKKTRLTTNWRYLPLLIIMLLSSKVVLSIGHIQLGDLTPGQSMQAALLASQLGIDMGELSAKKIQKPSIKESLPRKLESKPSKIERLVRINNSGIGIIEEFTSEKPLKQFGYDLFTSVPLTFAPITDAPIPSDYIIGPGDTINILFFGKKSSEVSLQVTRGGNLNIHGLGPVSVAGLSFSELKENLSERVATQMIGVKVSISLGALRSIRIFVLGDVHKPGSYTVNALSTLSNAILASGGIKRIGSLRDIQLKRKGMVVSRFDLYDLLLQGDTSDDHRLLPGDVVFVPPINTTVGVYGEVRRPAIYELKKGQENLEQVLLASGGVLPSAKQTNILIKSAKSRQGKTVFEFNLIKNNPKSFKLMDGDIVRVSPELEHNLDGFVTLTGEVIHPGVYSISPGETLTSVIQRAGGFTQLAYLDGAIFVRNALKVLENKRKEESLRELEKSELVKERAIGATQNYESLQLFINNARKIPSLGRMVISLPEIMNGIGSDVALKHGDSLNIPTQPQAVTVIGEVNYSTSHIFDPSLTLDQYIDRSGGVRKSADVGQIYVIKASGSVVTVSNTKNSFFRDLGEQSLIAAGDTIVIPIDTERASPMEVWASVTQVTSQIAITLASFKTLGIF
jgi:protein involved in polysaccharide export with SLBB domain